MLEYPENVTCPLTVDIGHCSTATVLVVGGEIDIATAPVLEEAITDALARPDTPVVLDLTGVSFADSSALSLLMRTRRDAGSRLVIGACSTNIERLFDITGINPLLGRVHA